MYTTNNNILLKRYKTLPAINCLQKSAQKKIVTEKDLIQCNIDGLGNKVGSITNRVTGMIDLLSDFEEGSNEYKELQYRILCGQHFQQNELDKLKGIKASEMPKKWYNYNSCEDDFERSIVSYKQPYFMIYIYPQTKQKYKRYIEQCEIKCQRKFKKALNDLIANPQTKEENEFLYYFNKGIPVNMSNSTMNRICKYIESHFNNYTTNLKSSQDFDYTFMKTGRKCYNIHREPIEALYKEYLSNTKEFNKYKTVYKLNKSEALSRRQHMMQEFSQRAKEICPNDCERLDILLDTCYQSESNKSFCWLVCGDLIIKKLKGELTVDFE